MKRLFWLLPILLATLVTGCLKDDPSERTIVLLGTESEVKPIEEVIPDTLTVFIKDSVALNLPDRKSTRLNSSHTRLSRMPSSA